MIYLVPCQYLKQLSILKCLKVDRICYCQKSWLPFSVELWNVYFHFLFLPWQQNKEMIYIWESLAVDEQLIENDLLFIYQTLINKIVCLCFDVDFLWHAIVGFNTLKYVMLVDFVYLTVKFWIKFESYWIRNNPSDVTVLHCSLLYMCD